MAIAFTDKQKEVLKARDHDILVSAAAGSGKTAVLVERILRLVQEGRSIDRLLVVTFTRAAAAQMRERLSAALSALRRQEPDNRYLQRQEALLPGAQITTIDSFCSYILQNYFSEIGLDPGFAQMEETEAQILRSETLAEFLEEKYAQADPAFLEMTEYFSPGLTDRTLEDRILQLYDMAVSHPHPEEFFAARKRDYAVTDEAELQNTPWFCELLSLLKIRLREAADLYGAMKEAAQAADGPSVYLPVLLEEEKAIGELLAGDSFRELALAAGFEFTALPRLAGKKAEGVDEDKKAAVRRLREEVKKTFRETKERFFSADPERETVKMKAVAGPLGALLDTAAEFYGVYAAKKRAENVIDFADLEHLALQVLLVRNADGSYSARDTALAFRRHFEEIMIDEYQDSNEVQELLLKTISREEEGRFNRFMVGDVKQSIYKFRLARPEIFVDKFDSYAPGDLQRERIDLDQNFRSREEVLDIVNLVFSRIMRKEIGGVSYSDEVSLKKGASFPEQEGPSPYVPELLIVDGAEDAANDAANAADGAEAEDATLSAREKEAFCIAAKIREIVGNLLVKDEETGGLRPAKYRDIVVLLRATSGWNEEFRHVFEAAGIPASVTSRTGYFAAEEIRMILELLRALDNPRQDIPLYGVLHGFFGSFTEEEIARIRIVRRDALLYDALCETAAGKSALSRKAGAFLERFRALREKVSFLSLPDLLNVILDETGYENYIAALPGGQLRSANLSMLLSQADAFSRTSRTGLFRFLRYIDELRTYEIDYGEANTLSEEDDVVRIMSIHKSKGLEFPVCFVAGLGKRFNRRDLSGALLCDMDSGLGTDFIDIEARTRDTTLRREAVAEKIARDSLGEEIRILYVAMTRAKEKLYLTGYFRNFASTAVKTALAAGEADGPLPVRVISRASGFGELILYALSGMDLKGRLKYEVLHAEDFGIYREAEQHALGERKERIDAALAAKGKPAGEEKYRIPENLLDFRYTHEDLKGLYTKTTVTELKEAYLERLKPEGEESAFLFPEETALPGEAAAQEPETLAERFGAAQAGGGAESSGAAQRKAGSKLTGAARGSAVHRLLELFDYGRFEAGRPDAEDILVWIRELCDAGRVPPAFAENLLERDLADFLATPLGARMAAAARGGRLRREQPFMLGVSASLLDSRFPESETILVQGIIDAFFEEDGAVVIVDYKTDRVRSAEELADRYAVQLMLYEKAVRQITEKPVSACILYSVHLKEEVRVDTGAGLF